MPKIYFEYCFENTIDRNDYPNLRIAHKFNTNILNILNF